jgi:hypothetical protein
MRSSLCISLNYRLKTNEAARIRHASFKFSYAAIANCKTRRDTPVAARAKNPCATRRIKFVLFMCAYPLTNRRDDRMRRPRNHNKRTI